MRNVLHKLRKQVHRTPYVFSGATPYGWDCSGMVVWAYEQLGITLPHSANKQAHAGKPTRNPHAGDIVLFRKRWSNTYYHAAIYLGHGKVINANSMWRTTVVQPLTDYAGDHIRYVQVVQQ
jgi:cell wall-associated NlpC family hydrolase